MFEKEEITYSINKFGLKISRNSERSLPKPIDFQLNYSTGWSKRGGFDLKLMDQIESGAKVLECPEDKIGIPRMETSGYSKKTYTAKKSYPMVCAHTTLLKIYQEI